MEEIDIHALAGEKVAMIDNLLKELEMEDGNFGGNIYESAIGH